MAKIKITAPFRGCQRLFDPGEYYVPGDMTAIEAKCAIADGVAHYPTEATMTPEPFRQAPAGEKGAAPENKLAAPAPETKAPVASGDCGGQRAKPDAGSRKGVQRKAGDRGK
jgi:hypothetical protein